MNIFEISEHTRNLQSAIQFLHDREILRSIPALCPSCNNPMSKNNSDKFDDGYTWRCSKRHENDGLNISRCNTQKGPRVGSFLETQKIELKKFIMMAYFWAHGVSGATQLSMIDFSEKSVVQWNQHFRDVCSRHLLENPI